MTPEDLERVKVAHARALPLSLAEREAFLRNEFPDEPNLQREVERLLRWHDDAGEFLNTPLASRILEPLASDFRIERIGPWELVRELGQGGSATVYLARRADDLFEKLVAIKLLNRLLHSEDVFRRFQREIQILARVEHPYIVRLLEAGTTGEALAYIVTEFVDGKRIDEFAAPLSLTEKLRLFLKVSEAVSYAHGNMIVHRDLKPSNILVTQDGTPKILDFGIARLLDRDSQLTETGHDRMTLRYASPEQIKREKPITAASDIYSLGVILYELIADKSPYGGAEHEVAARIVSDEPLPLNDVPMDLETIVQKALRKSPAERYLSVEALRHDLVRFVEGLPATARIDPAGFPLRTPLRRRALATGLGAAALALGIGFYARSGRPEPGPPEAVSLEAHDGQPLALSFSPDGRWIYYLSGDEFFNYADLFARNLETGTTVQLTKDGIYKRWPVASPNGEHIAFVRLGRDDIATLSFLSPSAATETTLFTGPVSQTAWSADSRSLVIAYRSDTSQWPHLRGFSLERKEWWEITSPPAEGRGDHYPAISPDAKTLCFVRKESRESADLFLLQLDSSLRPVDTPHRLTSRRLRIVDPHWTPDGKGIVFAGGTLGNFSAFHVAVDGRTEPVEIVGAGSGIEALALSQQARRLAVARTRSETNIWKLELTGSGQVVRTTRLQLPAGIVGGGILSPDGKLVAFAARSSGELQIWIASSDGTASRQITSYSAPDIISPLWLPGGSGLVVSVQSRMFGVKNFIVSLNRPDEREIAGLGGFAVSFSRDGGHLYFNRVTTGSDVYRYTMDTGEIRQITRNERAVFAVEGTDGRTLYFTRQQGEHGLWQLPLTGGVSRQILPSLARRTLFSIHPEGIYHVQREARALAIKLRRPDANEDIELYRTTANPGWGLSVSSGARTILFSQEDTMTSEVRLLRNFE